MLLSSEGYIESFSENEALLSAVTRDVFAIENPIAKPEKQDAFWKIVIVALVILLLLSLVRGNNG